MAVAVLAQDLGAKHPSTDCRDALQVAGSLARLRPHKTLRGQAFHKTPGTPKPPFGLGPLAFYPFSSIWSLPALQGLLACTILLLFFTSLVHRDSPFLGLTFRAPTLGFARAG